MPLAQMPLVSYIMLHLRPLQNAVGELYYASFKALAKCRWSREGSLYNLQTRQKAISCFPDSRMSRKSQATAQSSFKCQVCGKVFGQQGHLFIHKNVHAEVRPFGCDTCGRRFSQKGNLLRHSLLHTNEKPFGCGVCRKFFVQKAHL
nr:zinc finger protein 260-like [Penaeus vannamei]